jgi:phage-related protein
MLNQLFTIGAGTDTWEVPFPVPFKVGASTIDSNIAISYDGNAPSYPIIRITGVATDPVLTNETLGLKLDFTGTTIAAADYYEIDLRYGRKTVVDSAGANQLADLTTDSDISSFRIAADPDAPGGINSLNFTCTAATLATACTVVYYERYIGI